MMKKQTRRVLITGYQLFALVVMLSVWGWCLADVAGATPRVHPEKVYQKVFCDGLGGVMEARQWNGKRVDCLTADHAWEVDFANKWQEAVGQSLEYATLTGRLPGILLIIEKPSDWRHWRDLLTTLWAQGVTITTRTIIVEEVQ